MNKRPSNIDIFLTDHPDLRTAFEAIAIDPGLTVDRMVSRLQAHGCKASRSAVSRWRGRYHKRPPGPLSELRYKVIVAVATASDSDLEQVALTLKVS